MEYEVQVFVPNEDVEAQEDFCYFFRRYRINLMKECSYKFETDIGTLYFGETFDNRRLDKKSLSDEFPHLDFLAVEPLRAKKRVGEKKRINLSDYGRLFSIKKPRPSFA